MLAGRDSPEWLRVYRGLEHPLCKTACEEIGRNLEFSSGIKNCANHFISLQKARHSADYDPSWRISGVNAKAHIAAAREAINELFEAPLRERQTFALRRLIRRPRN